ncbi:MAG TPA: MOSC domain-containing protein [Actinomycetota bacterium]|nr:MOSC domain-containing protein [Actinomycetota bacterium]
MSGTMATVARLNVTPVKSTALHHPDRIRIERWGAVGNREFFFLDEDGKLFGGSKLGPLVRIRAEHDTRADVLRMEFPDGVRIEGPAASEGETLVVNFWGRAVTAHVVEGKWSEHLSRYARRDLRLARVERPGDGNDIRPITLVSLASVEELERQGGADGPLDPARFRMTIELDGLAPHEEDSWAGRRVRVGDTTLLVGDPVPRCVVTTQDPSTGERDFPTLSVIKRYRGAVDGDLLFGMYASVVDPGDVRVGDPVAPES